MGKSNRISPAAEPGASGDRPFTNPLSEADAGRAALTALRFVAMQLGGVARDCASPWVPIHSLGIPVTLAKRLAAKGAFRTAKLTQKTILVDRASWLAFVESRADVAPVPKSKKRTNVVTLTPRSADDAVRQELGLIANGVKR